MKKLLLIAAVFFTWDSFGQGDAPPLLHGQTQTAKSVGAFIRTPNNQITKLSAASSLIETGNRNLLTNPGFEHQTFSTGWTTSGTATYSAETTTPIAGVKSFKAAATAQTISLIQDTTIFAAALSGSTGILKFSADNTATGASACVRANGVTLAGPTNCVTISNSGVKQEYQIGLTFNGTSNGVEISAASTTGTLIVDNVIIEDEILGSLVTYARVPDVTSPRSCSFEISSAGVVSKELGNCVNGNCSVSDVSLFTCTWNAGFFTTTVNCTNSSTTGNNSVFAAKETSPTTTAGEFRTATGGGTKTAVPQTVSCHGD